MKYQVEKARSRWPLASMAWAMFVGILIGCAAGFFDEERHLTVIRADSEATERSLTARIDNLKYDLQYCHDQLPRPERWVGPVGTVNRDAREVVIHWLYPGVESYGEPIPWQDAVHWIERGRDACYRNGCVEWLEDVKPPPSPPQTQTQTKFWKDFDDARGLTAEERWSGDMPRAVDVP